MQYIEQPNSQYTGNHKDDLVNYLIKKGWRQSDANAFFKDEHSIMLTLHENIPVGVLEFLAQINNSNADTISNEIFFNQLELWQEFQDCKGYIPLLPSIDYDEENDLLRVNFTHDNYFAKYVGHGLHLFYDDEDTNKIVGFEVWGLQKMLRKAQQLTSQNEQERIEFKQWKKEQGLK